MVNRKLLYTVGGVLLVGWLVTSSASAFGDVGRTTYLTFNRPVSVPGVSLAPGTYRFEIVNPNTSSDIVRVSNRDRSRVYWTGFTLHTTRPGGMKRDQVISFGEAPVNTPLPIKAWYFIGENTGRQFIY